MAFFMAMHAKESTIIPHVVCYTAEGRKERPGRNDVATVLSLSLSFPSFVYRFELS